MNYKENEKRTFSSTWRQKMNTENEYIKTSKNGSIYFDPTCDDNTPVEIDHSKDHFNIDEKEVFFENDLQLVIKNGVNFF